MGAFQWLFKIHCEARTERHCVGILPYQTEMYFPCWSTLSSDGRVYIGNPLSLMVNVKQCGRTGAEVHGGCTGGHEYAVLLV